MPIDAPDRLEYNGYRFPNAFTKTEIAYAFKPDSSGRTITHTVATVKASAHIAAEGLQEFTMETLLTALERPGAALVVQGKGIPLEINTASGARDLKWGPTPKVLTWQPLGGGEAAKVVWTCEVALLCCTDAPWHGILEFNYGIAFATDEGGYTTRTISGALTVAMTRVTPVVGAIPDSADNYFDQVVPATLPNFKRAIQRTLSEAKDKLTFVITDTEQAGNPLPPNVVSAKASHTQNTVQPGLINWTGTVTAEYEFQKDTPRSLGWELFKELVRDRAAADRRDGFGWLPISNAISEPEIYGRNGAAFSMTYRTYKKPAPGDIAVFPLTGIWRPVPGADWNVWSASLNIARANRGVAGLQHRPGHDVIVDLCLGQPARIRTDGANAANRGNAGFFGGRPGGEGLAQILGVPYDLDPLAAWGAYECRVVVEPVDHNVVHKPLPVSTGGAILAAGLNAGAIQQAFSSPTNSFYVAPQHSPPAIVQNGGSTDFYVRLVGRAIRVGHEIPPPTILNVFGSSVVPMNHPDAGTFFSTWTAGFSTHPVQAAEWNLRWFLKLPQGITGISVASQPRPDTPGNIMKGTVR